MDSQNDRLWNEANEASSSFQRRIHMLEELAFAVRQESSKHQNASITRRVRGFIARLCRLLQLVSRFPGQEWSARDNFAKVLF